MVDDALSSLSYDKMASLMIADEVWFYFQTIVITRVQGRNTF